MVLVNWLLIGSVHPLYLLFWHLIGEVAQVLEAECLKKFQVRFVVLHRLRLRPWAHASLLFASHSPSSLRLWFSFLSVFVDRSL